MARLYISYLIESINKLYHEGVIKLSRKLWNYDVAQCLLALKCKEYHCLIVMLFFLAISSNSSIEKCSTLLNKSSEAPFFIKDTAAL